MNGQFLLLLIISVTGLLLIILGWYIHKAKAYQLIAGFNSLSGKERENLNREKFVRTFRNVFFIMGILMIISYPVLSLVGFEKFTSLIAVLVVIIGAVFLNYKSRDFFKKARKKG